MGYLVYMVGIVSVGPGPSTYTGVTIMYSVKSSEGFEDEVFPMLFIKRREFFFFPDFWKLVTQFTVTEVVTPPFWSPVTKARKLSIFSGNSSSHQLSSIEIYFFGSNIWSRLSKCLFVSLTKFVSGSLQAVASENIPHCPV
jgi:hypothetical protein